MAKASARPVPHEGEIKARLVGSWEVEEALGFAGGGNQRLAERMWHHLSSSTCTARSGTWTPRTRRSESNPLPASAPGEHHKSHARPSGRSIQAALATEAWRRRGLSSLPARDRLAFLCTGAWTLTLILEVVVHRWLQVKYPPDRAAIWMVPLCTLSVLMLVNRACEMSARWGQTVRWLVLAGGVAVIGVYLANFQVSYFKTWRYDAGTKALWGRIARGRDATGTPIRVGGQWLFEPSVNFYRRLSDGDAGTRRVLPFSRLAHPDPQQFDYFFFNPVDFPDLDLRRLTVIGVDPVSGVMLVTPKRP